MGPSQRGVALVIVLWVLVLITVTTGAFTILARTENLQAHQLLAGTKARYAAEAGLNLAILKVRDPNEFNRWIADGRTYYWNFEGQELEIQMVDERGKINLNNVNELTLVNWLVAMGLEDEQVAELTDAILDWLDPDDFTRAYGAEYADYEAAGLPYGPSNAPFVILEELQQVLGVNHELFKKLEPALSLHASGRGADPMYAPYEALLSLPGMTPELAQEHVTLRSEVEAGVDPLIQLPDGTSVAAMTIGQVHSITVKATGPNGIWEQIEATVTFGNGIGERPYEILRWREGVRG
jgi:general secretion pathway protein K